MKAIIMAGGKGTRVADLTKNQIPKPMLPIEGRPILEWQLLQLKKYDITDVVMVIGYLGDVIKNYFGDGSGWGMRISYITETEPLGTAGALYYLRSDAADKAGSSGIVGAHGDVCSHGRESFENAQTGESYRTSDAVEDARTDAYFFCMGDIFFDFDIARMKKFHDEKGAFITLLAHPNMHPQDSDLVVVANVRKDMSVNRIPSACDKPGHTDAGCADADHADDKRVIAFDSKHNVRDYWFDNLVNAGIFIFSPSVPYLVNRPEKLSLEKDIIAPVLSEKKVYAYVTPEFVKDVGTPDRIAETEEDLKSGFIAAKNLMHKQKAIFLDRDGTVNELRGFISHEDEFVLEKNAAEAIRRINRSGYLAIVVTNQPVIARGEATFEEVENLHRKMKTLLGREGCYVDDVLYCPHHPDKGFEGEIPELKIECRCRKPKTGMLEEAARRWNIDLNESWVIGDGTIDMEMGHRAGCRTMLVKTGNAGTDGKYEVIPDCTADDILAAVNLIIES